MDMTQNHTDLELVARMRTGSEDAFAEIYRRYWPSLFDQAYRRLAPPQVTLPLSL